MSTDQKFMVSESEVLSLIPSAHLYHHKMNDQAERDANAFNRCRDLAITNVQTYFLTKHLTTPPKVAVSDELIRDALEEAAKRYPDSARAILWLSAALSARLAQPVVACDACESTGVFDTDGNGPYDCYACGKKSQAAQGELSGNSGVLEAQSEIARLKAVIERDRTVFCNLLVRLKNAVKGRQHLGDENARAASGYNYDEDGFIKEFGDAYTEIMSALEHAHRVFQDFTDCPKGNAILEAQVEANAILSKPQPAERAAVPEEVIELLRDLSVYRSSRYKAVLNAFGNRAKSLLDSLSAAPTLAGKGSYQQRVADWMQQAFIPSLYSNMTERGDRLLEEVLELLQAHGYDQARVATLVQYVFGRPAGEPAQEVGGVMVTLAGYCFIAGLDMHAAGEAELARIGRPEVMAKIRAKQEAKNALHFDTPLPGLAVGPEQ